MDALLLGTILFVTISFLFPTLVAFYLAFVSVSPASLLTMMPKLTQLFQSRLLILSVQAVLLTGVSALNAFPLFALLLRFKSPRRLPGASPSPSLALRLTFRTIGGVDLEACDDARHWPDEHLHLRVPDFPLPSFFLR